MYVAVTMKMMRRTRTTSTSGVTLISAMRSSSSPPSPVPATYAPPGRALEVRDRGVAERGRALGGAAERALEEVVRDDRGERDEEADRGRDERLADAGHHRTLPRPRPGSARGRRTRGSRRAPSRTGPTKGALFPSVPRKARRRSYSSRPRSMVPATTSRTALRALAGVLDDRAHDRRLEPLAPADRGRGAGEVAREQPPRDVVRAAEPAREEERGALDHDPDRGDREEDEKPQHPLGAEVREGEETVRDHGGADRGRR